MNFKELIVKNEYQTLQIKVDTSYITNNPTCCIKCIEHYDGDYVEISFYPNLEQIDLIITQLQETQKYLQKQLLK